MQEEAEATAAKLRDEKQITEQYARPLASTVDQISAAEQITSALTELTMTGADLGFVLHPGFLVSTDLLCQRFSTFTLF